MKKLKHAKQIWLGLSLMLLPSVACFIGTGSQGTAIPAGRPEDFEVQTATATSTAAPGTATPTVQKEAEVLLLLDDAATHTPDPKLPTPTSTLVVVPTEIETAEATEEPTAVLEATEAVTLTETSELTPTVVAPPVAAQPVSEPDPPLQGGDWDFEGDYVPWGNPYGEPCPGASVATGWVPFVEDGPFGSSCLNENLYQPNVLSGGKSQEITFDFISANSGILRSIPTKPQHRYSIVAHAKHDHSLSPVEMSLGVDLTGGTIWADETVTWFPWDDAAEDTWVATEETVTATGEQMTIFIRGFHPLAEQGGKTVIDNIVVTDLGP